MKNIKIANKIREMRQQRAWSQSQLAIIASLSIRTVQRAENEGASSYETLLAIASAFEVDVKEFTSLSDERKLFANSVSEEGLQLTLAGYTFFLKGMKPSKAAITSFVIIFPAIYFLSSAILKYILGIHFFFDLLLPLYEGKETLQIFNIISPIVFLSGLIASAIINFAVLFSFSVSQRNSTLETSVSFNKYTANVFICGISILSLMMIAAYAIGENFMLR